MPKELRVSVVHRHEASAVQGPLHATRADLNAHQRSTTTWTAEDDAILLAARASGRNWQPIAEDNFPGKTGNACRKRYERLMERRSHQDWNCSKLEALAVQYKQCKKEMWKILASKLGERWEVLEAKCMEKGLKNLQALARRAQRMEASDHCDLDAGKKDEHEGDSGIGVSDAEMEIGDAGTTLPIVAPRPLPPLQLVQNLRPLQIPPIASFIPLYEPPLSARTRSIASDGHQRSLSCEAIAYQRLRDSRSPEKGFQRGVSIQSMLVGHTADTA